MAFCVEHALILEISTGWEFEPFLMSLSCFFTAAGPFHQYPCTTSRQPSIMQGFMFPILFVFCFYSDFYLLFVSCVLCSWSWKWRTRNTKCPVCINSVCFQAGVLLDLSCVWDSVCVFWECLCSMWVQLVEVCSVSFESTHHHGLCFRK